MTPKQTRRAAKVRSDKKDDLYWFVMSGGLELHGVPRIRSPSKPIKPKEKKKGART